MELKRLIRESVRPAAMLLVVLVLGVIEGYAQKETYNPIPSSVQMLNIGPEARGTSMGDVGVATSPDINSQHWNPAKYVMMDSKAGASLSITPWLRNIISDINLFYLAGYYKINQRNAVSASLRYFSLGDLIFTDEDGTEEGTYKPREFAIDAAYSILLSKEFSGAIALRYIRSDMGYQFNDDGYSAGNAFAADIAFYYKKHFQKLANGADLMAGINISNIGTKITYDNGVTNEYLPANLRLGVGFQVDIDKYNTLGASVDFNKLLVPTPDYRNFDASDDDTYQAKMKYYDQSSIGALFKSFGDAPGGFREELQEIDVAGGLEYSYNHMFFVRGGYHYNHENKGNLKYASVGLGVAYKFIDINASYLFTVGQANSNSALNNTIRISLGFDLGKVLNLNRRTR